MPKVALKFILIILLCFNLNCYGQESADLASKSQDKEVSESEITQDTSFIKYELIFDSSLKKRLLEKFKEVSVLLSLQKRPPGSYSGLLNRIKADKKLFGKVLFSKGYFSKKISFSIKKDKDIYKIHFHILTGNRYKMRSITFRAEDPINVYHLQQLNIPYEVLRIKPNDPINSKKCNEVQERVKYYCYKRGYPFVEVSEPMATIDHEKQMVDLLYMVHPGILAVINETEVEPMIALNQEFIKNRVTWHKGQIFDSQEIERSRNKLSETGILESVIITPKPTSQTLSKEPIPTNMHINAVEGPPIAIGAGLKYASFDGLAANLFWRHYNVGRNGEFLGIAGNFSKKNKKLLLNCNFQDVGVPKLKLLNEIFVVKEITRAYKGRIAVLSSMIQYPLTDSLSCEAGVSLEKSIIKRKQTSYNGQFFGLPLELAFDSSNDLLNPTRGIRAKGRFTPYLGQIGDNKNINVLKGETSIYLPLYTDALDEDTLVLANFARGGTIYSKKSEQIPPHKRFYSGGSGSIRGYGFQMLGPIDVDRVPTGGDSLVELGSELRYKLTQKIGAVVFLEAGSVNQKNVPSFQRKSWFYGCGVGGRYYTPIGPIRLDIGIPLKRRKGNDRKHPIDSPFQIYISIGSAF